MFHEDPHDRLWEGHGGRECQDRRQTHTYHRHRRARFVINIPLSVSRRGMPLNFLSYESCLTSQVFHRLSSILPFVLNKEGRMLWDFLSSKSSKRSRLRRHRQRDISLLSFNLRLLSDLLWDRKRSGDYYICRCSSFFGFWRKRLKTSFSSGNDTKTFCFVRRLSWLLEYMAVFVIPV